MKKWTIYKLTNPKGLVYIGKTVNLQNRLSKYRNSSCKKQRLLYNSLLKHGINSHEIKILDEFQSDSLYADGKEMFWIRSYMSNRSKWPQAQGLNLTNGGEGSVGYVPTEDVRRHHSNVMKGRSSHMKGKKHSQKVLDILRIRSTGNNYALGYKKTDEEKENWRKANINRFKPVIQYDLNGNKVNEFESVGLAAKYLGVTYGCVKSHVRGLSKTCQGFVFKLKNQ